MPAQIARESTYDGDSAEIAPRVAAASVASRERSLLMAVQIWPKFTDRHTCDVPRNIVLLSSGE